MEKIEAMRIFLRVAELRSFTQAAESLTLPKASVSMAVAQLEQQLGTRLLQRTTRRVSVTPDGQSFYDRCQTLVADMDEAETMFRSEAELIGRLRVDLPVALAKRVVIPSLGEFLRAHPRLSIELSTTDRLVDLIGEGFDCVVRAGGSPIGPELGFREIARMEMVNCASPEYVERFGKPTTLKELAEHHLVHYVPRLGTPSPGFEYWDGQRCHYVEMQGSVTVNNSDAYQAACLAGLGITQVPRLGVEKLLQNGTLVSVLDEFPSEPMPLRLLYQSRQSSSRRLRAFQEWIVELLQR